MNKQSILKELNKQEEDYYDDSSPYSGLIQDNRTPKQDQETELLLEIARNFYTMRLRKILKKGDIFGEFDEGNLNLLSQGYMSRKRSFMVQISSSIYNEMILKHQVLIVDRKIRFLQQFSFFKHFSKQKMKNYIKFFENVTLYRNNIVYQELDPANYIYFIESGEVEISRLFKLSSNSNGNEEKEKPIPVSELNSQNFDLNFNPFEKQEKEMYHLNQGKQHNERNKLITRVNSFILGPNQYFGEKEVLTNSFRLTQVKVISEKLEVVQLPSHMYYDHFYYPEAYDTCLLESQMREVEQIKIFDQVQSRQPYQNIVEKLENDYLQNFAKNNRKKNITEVANYKDTYLNKKEFNDLVFQEQMKKTNKYMTEMRSCKISFLQAFMSKKSKLSSPTDSMPFYDHVKQYVESADVHIKTQQPLKQAQDSRMSQMLKFCSTKHQRYQTVQTSNLPTKENSFIQIINQQPQNISKEEKNSSDLNSFSQAKIQTLEKSKSEYGIVQTTTTENTPKQQSTTFTKKRIFSAVPSPMAISSISLSRKYKYKQELSRKTTLSKQLNSEIEDIKKQTPSVQQIKQQSQRYSFHSDSPKSILTAPTTRIKNSSRGSMFSQFNDMQTIITNTDSFKDDDQYLEPQFSHHSITEQNQQAHHQRRKTTHSVL